MELFLRPCFTSKFSTLHEVLGWKNDLNYEFLLEYMKKNKNVMENKPTVNILSNNKRYIKNIARKTGSVK